MDFAGGTRVKEPTSHGRRHKETQVLSLGQEDALEEGMATHSSILAWRIPWTEEPDGLQSMGSQRVGHDRATKHNTAAIKGLLYASILLNTSQISHFCFGCWLRHEQEETQLRIFSIEAPYKLYNYKLWFKYRENIY